MRKLRVLCSSLMIGLVASSMVVNTVKIPAKAAVAASVDSEEDEDTIYYDPEDGVTLTDLYGDGIEVEEQSPVLKPDGIVPLIYKRKYFYSDTTLAPGKLVVLRACIFNIYKHNVVVEFTPSKTGTLVVGFKVDGNNGEVIASKQVNCTANVRKEVTIVSKTYVTFNPFILNNTGVSVTLNDPAVRFICDD